MKTFKQFHEQAEFLRESTGSTNIKKTLLKAIRILKIFDIPHLVCGGIAVQESGYPRLTVDVDIMVPDVQAARERLGISGFRKNEGSSMTLTDRETKVEVDLLPGGKSVGPGPVNLPVPKIVSEIPQLPTQEQLITMKLSSWMGNKLRRTKDLADVVELIHRTNLKRNLNVDLKVKEEYLKIWDELHK